jgi:hypothetical protein
VKEFREVPVYLDRPYEVIREVDRFVEYPVDRIVEVPVDRYVEVPVDRVVERIVEVPVDRIVEVPVEHIVDRIVETRDEREILRMRDENDEMASLLRVARNENNELDSEMLDMQDRFSKERERLRREYEEEINYSRDRIRNMDKYIVLISKVRSATLKESWKTGAIDLGRLNKLSIGKDQSHQICRVV